MNKWTLILGAAMVALSLSTTAEAGKKGKDKGAKEAKGSSADMEIQTTGIEQVDAVFEKAKAPIETVMAATAAVDGVSMSLNEALGLDGGTPFADAINDLKAKADGKVSVAMEGEVPTVSAADGTPENLVTAIDNLNKSLKDAATALAGLAEISAQVQAVAEEGKSFADPAVLKDLGATPGQLLKAPKAVGSNLKVLGAAPGAVTDLASSFADLGKTLTSAFSG
jgi:hypothetical protein